MDSTGTGFSRFQGVSAATGPSLLTSTSVQQAAPPLDSGGPTRQFRPSRPSVRPSVPSVPSVRPSGRITGLAHPKDNPTKSCTSRPPWAAWDLDPIQSFTKAAFGGFLGPGENDRRYSNASRLRRLAPLPTRTLRAAMSPEARSGPRGHRVRRDERCQGVVYGGGVPPGHAPGACPGGYPTTVPHPWHRSSRRTRCHRGPERASGLKAARRATGRKQGSREAGKQGCREAGSWEAG